jgi:hypothetical protein
MTPKPAYDENGRWYYSAASLRNARQTTARAQRKRDAQAAAEQLRLAEHLAYVEHLEGPSE